jgi:hypothetical protein
VGGLLQQEDQDEVEEELDGPSQSKRRKSSCDADI